MSVLRRWWDVLVASAAFATASLVVTVAWDLSGDAITDIPLYHTYGERVANGLVPYRDFAFEYPPGALVPIVAPAVVTESEDAYRSLFMVVMALVGLVGALLLAWTLTRLGRSRTERRWTLAVVAVLPLFLGGVILTRFDLLPAALVVVALLLAVSGRLRAAAVTVGVGAAVKLYPALLLPLLAVAAWRRSGRAESGRTLVLGIAPFVLAYLPFLVVSPGGVLDSFGRQLSRPLQIESLGAGVLLALHQAFGTALEWSSGSGSQNLTSTGADAIAALLGIAQVVALALVWVSFARGPVDGEGLVRHAAAAVVAFVALSKVLSPQFLVWLVLLVPLVGGARRPAALALTALACAQTAVWFPARYWELVKEFDGLASWLVLTRGLTLLALLAVLILPETSLDGVASRPAKPASGGASRR